MSKQEPQNFPQLFIANLVREGDVTLFCEKHQKMFLNILRKELAYEVNTFSRALHAIGVEADARVTIQCVPSQKFWISEWAALSIRANAVIVPQDFSVKELIDTLIESRSKVLIVDSLETAEMVTLAKPSLKDLTHIICTKWKSSASVSVQDWVQFKESGRLHADYTAQLLMSITPTATALLFYEKDEKQKLRVKRYSHKELIDYAYVIEKLLGEHKPKKGEIMISSPLWDRPTEHIVSCFLPVLSGLAVQVNQDKNDFSFLANCPHVLITTAAYLESFRKFIEVEIKNSGKLDWKMFEKSVAYGKYQYEKGNKVGFIHHYLHKMLNATVVKKVKKMLGERLHLIIGVDDAATYEMQVFFHAFGVEMIELPSESFKHLV